MDDNSARLGIGGIWCDCDCICGADLDELLLLLLLHTGLLELICEGGGGGG